LLYDLGLDNEVCGITKFCIHPTLWFQTKTRIGGTKNVHIEKVLALKPDLVIANKEENLQEQVDELARTFPVWTSDINTLEDALDMIEKIGVITGKPEKANTLVQSINRSFESLPQNAKAYRTAYLIWKDPYMTIGGDTFINDLLQRAGFENIFAPETRYPQITIEQLQAADCQLLLLSSEPYPFKQKHIEVLKSQLPKTKIVLADGEMFSWYGSRLIHSVPYFNRLRIEIESMA
jgi:ABC-type Fe3+-hydroxamate transport system substrate-binding protein